LSFDKVTDKNKLALFYGPRLAQPRCIYLYLSAPQDLWHWHLARYKLVYYYYYLLLLLLYRCLSA